jgi:hypothetical protein
MLVDLGEGGWIICSVKFVLIVGVKSVVQKY